MQRADQRHYTICTTCEVCGWPGRRTRRDPTEANRMRLLVACLSCVLLCAGVATCGQKGPLRLPQENSFAPAAGHVFRS